MATLVGTQTDFIDVLKALAELDYDAVEAYAAAISRLQRTDFKVKLSEFKSDHERHIGELSRLIREQGETPPTGPSAVKQWIAKGKVVIATLMGDEAILNAMISNEDDTNVAYERALNHPNKWLSADPALQRALLDERRHRAWMQQAVEKKDKF